MKLSSKVIRRIRLSTFAFGLVALLLMVGILATAGRSSVSPTVDNGFTWGTAVLSIIVILLVWRERSERWGLSQEQ